MSTVIFSAGSAWNSVQVQLTGDWPPSTENVHLASGVCCVGPADRTGKSCVTYWPGGTRPAGSASSWRRWKPREIGLIAADYALRRVMPRPGGIRREPRHSGWVVSRYHGGPRVVVGWTPGSHWDLDGSRVPVHLLVARRPGCAAADGGAVPLVAGA